MKTIMLIVNFISAKSSLQHRQFKSLLQEFGPQFNDLLLHNNSRRLSKENVIQRFINRLNEIKPFSLQSTHLAAKDHSKFLSDSKNVAYIAFLADIFQHKNSLNLKHQGNQKFIAHLVSEVYCNCLCKKWNIFGR